MREIEHCREPKPQVSARWCSGNNGRHIVRRGRRSGVDVKSITILYNTYLGLARMSICTKFEI